MAAMVCHAQYRMVVMSDPHVMSKSLFEEPYGGAMLKTMQADLKVPEDSQYLFDQFIGLMLREKPQLVLVPGDLTRDGEKVSHEYVARRLGELKAAGINVYVIPGNHDMENPLAYSYHGDKAMKVPSVSEKEFMQIYKNCGYGEAVSTDTLTGSYMAYPADNLAVICMNSNIPNRYKARYVHGRLSAATLAWMERAAAKAHSEKRYIIAMVHHEVMLHHNQAETFAPTATTNMEKIKGQPSLSDVQNAFARAGIQVVLTGHYHIQSITDVNTLFDKLTDVSTGSLSGFPSPYRYMTLNDDGRLTITSATMFGNKTSKWPYTELSQKEMGRLRYMLQIYVPKLPGIKTNMTDAYSYLADKMETVLCALAAGDEAGHSPKKAYTECMDAFDRYVRHAYNHNVISVDKVKADPKGPYHQFSDLVRSIMYNYVGDRKHVNADNSVVIKLQTQ